ncbi:MAG: LptA/OstA family protein [Verrucomicrobiota bacterium]
MKTLLICLLATVATATAWAQTEPAAPGQPTQPPTTVTSDTLRLDMDKRFGVFSGNVKVEGTDFSMDSRELEVFFDAKSKVERLVAIGEVKIVQPGRETTANKADYDVRTNKILLTGSPKIIEDGRTITAPEIVIDRNTNSMQTGGGGTKLVIPGGVGGQ